MARSLSSRTTWSSARWKHDPGLSSRPKQSAPPTRRIDVDGEAFRYLDLGRSSGPSPATTCGLPAIVVPISVADRLVDRPADGGPDYEDRTPLAFARLIEQALGSFTPPPGYTHEREGRGLISAI